MMGASRSWPEGAFGKRKNNMTRQEHMDWCKHRALEYVERGDIQQAFASMASDLGKHKETQDHSAIELGMMLMISGNLSTAGEMRKFINGFN